MSRLLRLLVSRIRTCFLSFPSFRFFLYNIVRMLCRSAGRRRPRNRFTGPCSTQDLYRYLPSLYFLSLASFQQIYLRLQLQQLLVVLVAFSSRYGAQGKLRFRGSTRSSFNSPRTPNPRHPRLQRGGFYLSLSPLRVTLLSHGRHKKVSLPSSRCSTSEPYDQVTARPAAACLCGPPRLHRKL